MERMLRLGVAGLGRAFMLMLPTLMRHPRVRLTAACDTRAAARDCFARDFDAATYETIEALCADPDVNAVYIASPHQFHVEHVRVAAAHGKHILVEKPMALSIAECQAMIAAARQAGVYLVVGHSHSFDLPYLRTRALIDTGAFGAVRMIAALNYTDYLYRPRRPEELDTARGGGAVFSQAPHPRPACAPPPGCGTRRVRPKAHMPRTCCSRAAPSHPSRIAATAISTVTNYMVGSARWATSEIPPITVPRAANCVASAGRARRSRSRTAGPMARPSRRPTSARCGCHKHTIISAS